MTDPLDEFEFRPITSGLGFQNRKQAALPPQNDPEQVVVSNEELLSTPLPRKSLKESTPASDLKTPTVDEILQSLNKKRTLTFDESKRTTPKATLTRTENYNASAILLDTMLVVAGTLACLIILLVVTKSDLVRMLNSPDSVLTVYTGLALLVAGVSWIYLVANRLFLGYTPGEWVFDQQMGRSDQVGTALYGLKIVARSTIVIATGFILFPILSILLNSDVAGLLLNVELQKRA
jgi:hypothetical protein